MLKVVIFFFSSFVTVRCHICFKNLVNCVWARASKHMSEGITRWRHDMKNTTYNTQKKYNNEKLFEKWLKKDTSKWNDSYILQQFSFVHAKCAQKKKKLCDAKFPWKIWFIIEVFVIPFDYTNNYCNYSIYSNGFVLLRFTSRLLSVFFVQSNLSNQLRAGPLKVKCVK